ncbi:hypothetical protein H6G41_23615 [Tolypothrix sp. FACHB-123]|uniref:hypothetical protein n=1 Tax=Tolypothrix sp. FACHB-123 TaxID=2692868 RepID=UPI00168446C3|nr:hypothetical protein [Tolypothrix sp. FACHB-123]MBD2357565.1 hypothetical protein [Tolypothrix sp. FACHB-123]
MSADFLTTLAARTLGLTPIIQPAIASFFAPQYNMIEEGRGEDALIYDDTSLTSNSSSSLVAGGNSSAEISRLPYSRILAAAPDNELVDSQPVISPGLPTHDLPLQMGESAIAFSTEPLINTENLQLSNNIHNSIKNEISQFTPQTEVSNLIQSPTQNIVQRQVDVVTPLPPPSVASPNIGLGVSESVTPLVEPVINQANLQPQTPNQQNFDLQSSETLNNKETSNFQQHHQTIDAEIFPDVVEVAQPELKASSPVILPANSINPVVSTPENQQLLVSPEKDNFNSESSTAPPQSVLPLNTVTPVSSLENQPNLISPRQNDSAISQSNLLSTSGLNSNAVTPAISTSENQQYLVSQGKDNFNSESSTASPQSVLPLNTVTPVSSLDNQPNLISPRQDASVTSQSNLSPPSGLNSNAVIPAISPPENQQLLVSQKKDNFNSESSTTPPQFVLPLNTVTPVSSLENQPNLISPRQDASVTSPSNLSPPSGLNKNAVTPAISTSENQQYLVSQEKDNFNSESSTALPQSVLPTNTVIPVVSSLGNQLDLTSLKQNNPDFQPSASKVSPQSIVPANTFTNVFSSTANQQFFVSQQEDNRNFQPSASPISPQSVIPANTVTPIVSFRENQNTLISPRQNESATSQLSPQPLVPANALISAVSPRENQQPAISSRQDESGKITPALTGELSEITSQSKRQIVQNSFQESTAIPMPIPVTLALEQQNSANSEFPRQQQINRAVNTYAVITPLVDKRMLKNDRSSESWDLQTRLPSETIIAQNETKIKPLVTISQKRSLDFENDSQLTSKRELGNTQSSDAPPTVQVTIGRIEVRSAPAPTAPTANKKSSSRQPSVSLQDYLKQRQGGKL